MNLKLTTATAMLVNQVDGKLKTKMFLCCTSGEVNQTDETFSHGEAKTGKKLKLKRPTLQNLMEQNVRNSFVFEFKSSKSYVDDSESQTFVVVESEPDNVIENIESYIKKWYKRETCKGSNSISRMLYDVSKGTKGKESLSRNMTLHTAITNAVSTKNLTSYKRDDNLNYIITSIPVRWD